MAVAFLAVSHSICRWTTCTGFKTCIWILVFMLNLDIIIIITFRLYVLMLHLLFGLFSVSCLGDKCQVCVPWEPRGVLEGCQGPSGSADTRRSTWQCTRAKWWATTLDNSQHTARPVRGQGSRSDQTFRLSLFSVFCAYCMLLLGSFSWITVFKSAIVLCHSWHDFCFSTERCFWEESYSMTTRPHSCTRNQRGERVGWVL